VIADRTVFAFGQLFRRLWLNDTRAVKVSEEANRKSPFRNTTVQLSTPTPTLNATIRFVTDRQMDGRTDRQTTLSC